MKKRIITSLISIALFSSSASLFADNDKDKNSKAHGVGGVSAEHISEMRAEHNKAHLQDKLDGKKDKNKENDDDRERHDEEFKQKC